MFSSTARLPQPLNGFIKIISVSSLGIPKNPNTGLISVAIKSLKPDFEKTSKAIKIATMYGRLVRINSNDVLLPLTNAS